MYAHGTPEKGSGSTRRDGVAESCFVFLHMEMVQQVLRTHAEEREQRGRATSTAEADARGSSSGDGGSDESSAGAGAGAGGGGDSETATVGGALETPQAKLERLGFGVGQRLIELYTRDRMRFTDTLEIIKFVCKELWTEVYKKQIDNLRTNHRGVYVLHDSKFRWLTRISGAADNKAEAQKSAALHAMFPCGLIRGALSNLGITASIVADTSSLPSCTFTIKVT